MFALSPATTNSTALSALPAAVVVPASGGAVSRLTSVAIPAPSANTSLKNDTQNQASSASSGETTASAATSAQAANTTGGSSAAFLTQLISQSDVQQEDSQIALANVFAHFSPAPEYNQLVAYSVVKFRPSNAGLDVDNVSLPVAANASDEATVQQVSSAPASQAYNATQSRNQSNLADAAEPQVLVAG